jgi:6-phosphogluconolactonase (cycloisomerase 2 family)
VPDDDKRRMNGLARREFLGAIGALGGAMLIPRTQAAAKEPFTVYLGSFSTWGNPRGRGLEIGIADPATGQLTITGTVSGVPDASFLAVSPSRRILYAVNELKPQGRVTALDIGTDPRRPSVLNTQPAGGGGPTHLSVHPSGRYLLTANYTDGTVVVHSLLPDGRIGPVTDVARHEGETRPARAHQVVLDPSGRWVVAVDLGADSLYIYKLDLAAGRLSLNHRLKLPAGAGPRHLAFHPDGRYAYILGELRSEITVAAWDAAAGRFTPGQVIGTLGEAAPPRNLPAEIQVSPDGRFVYASNRGHNSIAMFSTGAAGGRLVFDSTTPTGGAWPRHFTLDPTGRWLYVANQTSNAVTWLPRDPGTGRLGAAAGSAAANGVGMVLFG